jgi:hypothetical protein
MQIKESLFEKALKLDFTKVGFPPLNSERANHLYIAISVAILIRIAVFFYLIYYPVPNYNPQQLISPIIMQTLVGDITIYRAAGKMYFSRNIITNIKHSLHARQLMVCPLYPALLRIFHYTDGCVLPLSITYVIFSIILSILWLGWLFNKKVNLFWLIFFAIIPNYLYFTFSISTDLFFSLLFAIYYIYYFKEEQTQRDVYIWILMAALMLLTRPNTLSIIIFIAIDYIFIKNNNRLQKITVFVIFVIISILSGIYFYDYFRLYLKDSFIQPLFGYTVGDYIHGVYNSLPKWLNYVCSYISLFLAKITYMVGLRPSYCNQTFEFVFLRAYTGLVLLPGLIYLFYQKQNKDKILILMFILPVIIGIPCERYLLPIYPLLFLYGIRSIEAIYRKMRMRLIPARS